MSTIRFEQRGDVGSLVLANPPRNELGRQFADDLLDAVHEASVSSIRALIIRAEGADFGAGGDVPEWPGKDASWFRTFIAEVNQAYAAIEALRIPTISAVRGAVVSGHYELALRADLIVASETATFTWVEAGTGFTPLAGGLQRLAERVGRGRAAAHVLLAETIDAVEAERIGLVYRVVADGELDSTADGLGAELARGATRGYAATRALLKAWSSGGVVGADALMLDLSMDLYDSVDTQNAIDEIARTATNGEDYVHPPFVGR
ncbi:enoyl-CoA hydratase/isomerase family protein [Microbacterium sp. SA39]|uniref:enoyl-CoA hydratase/isomerase family protein n=1 Tax=Microbacterium sp. SA39 TaxID=1263625 RepID=UPI00061EA751|nr:enoyl-CoA hydratase/isomerase family protein [Microbacterium sp. SA39]KJQ52707.1 putative enoyl-CoA hydratase echA8 [Microbacterium sp. SA39]